MPILNNFSKKVGDAAKTAAKKSGEIVEVTRLNRSISLDEDKINKLYFEVGRAFYAKWENGDSLTGDDLVGWCTQIKELNHEIEDLKEKLLQIKNIRVCPKCGNEVGPDILYCPKCGNKLEIHEDNE